MDKSVREKDRIAVLHFNARQTVGVLVEIFRGLPEDTRILRVENSVSGLEINYFLESKEFRAIPASQPLLEEIEVRTEYRENDDGQISCDVVEVTWVIDDKKETRDNSGARELVALQTELINQSIPFSLHGELGEEVIIEVNVGGECYRGTDEVKKFLERT